MILNSPSFESHEYLRDTLSLTYKECKSCSTRTELTCIKCGLCWSCHWMVEQMDKSKLSASSQIQSSADGGENNKQQKYILEKQDQYLRTNVIDVFGKQTEPICDYLRCHHKFSEHGLRVSKCQCRHPRNSAAGAYLLLHNI
jgi:hypothetical protein